MKNSIPLGFIRIFILLICLTSCGSKKQQKVALPAETGRGLLRFRIDRLSGGIRKAAGSFLGGYAEV